MTIKTRRFLAPKEHGAYGQLFLPMASALVAARGAGAAWLLAVAVAAVFVAHEPVLVLLGHRGLRRKNEEGAVAKRELVVLAPVALLAACFAFVFAASGTLLACVAPLVPGILLAPLVRARREKTTLGELLAALALTSCALPIARAGGAEWDVAIGLAAVWGSGMVLATLAVRIVLAAAKGKPLGALVAGLAGAGAATIAGAAVALEAGVVSAVMLSSVLPLVVTAATLAVMRPPARRLRETGFAILGAGVVTLVGVCLGVAGWN